MATAAHRARDRGASRDRRSLSESDGDRGAAAGRMGTATIGKTGQRERGDHRVGRGKTDPHDQPQPPRSTPTPTINPNPENLSTKEQAKAKPANEVTTGFGVESTGLEVENPKRIRSASSCEPFREAIELGLSRGRDATAIWQDLVAENGFDGGYQTVKRYVRKLRGNQPLQPRAWPKPPSLEPAENA